MVKEAISYLDLCIELYSFCIYLLSFYGPFGIVFGLKSNLKNFKINFSI